MSISYQEQYRPQIHFTPPSMWLNDPNGLVYFEGEYHLFYQHHPEGATWGPMHWGHAISADLVHWEHQPIALKPDGNGFIFSGSAVVDWQDTSGFFDGGAGLVAVFTHSDEYPGTGRLRQRQSLAYSFDKGRTWIMYAGNPVLVNEGITDFRDPKVIWFAPEQLWVMVLAAGDRVHFYTSPNLKEWSFASEFGAKEGSHAGVWECPDLVELPVEGREGRSKWVLIVSIGDHPDCPEGSRTQYFVGSFDGRGFANENSPDTVLWLDHGRDNYAGVTWSDVRRDGGSLLIGWMNNWKYANLTPSEGWRGAMTLPRVLRLREGVSGIRLVQQPVAELEQLRAGSAQWMDVVLQPDGHLDLSEQAAEFYELQCEIEPGGAAEVGLRLKKSEQGETVVGYRAAEKRLFLDRSRSGESAFHAAFACRHEAELELGEDGRLKLHLFVDRSSVEVFAGDGETVMTDQIFPDPSRSGLELYASGGAARLVQLILYRLQSIHTAK